MTGTYTVPDFGPSDLLTSNRYKYRRVRVDVGPGTYYWVFTNFGNGTATGVFSSFWEERPT